MGKIRVLDPGVASAIAAGEVVERPASAVKELVENSLDAGASEIRIRVAGGGIEEIQVMDDGEGMDRPDLLLALKRHATSKISRLEQLTSLKTLGFRGEAVPSIASVSRMTLASSPDASGEGTLIRVEGGRAEEPEVVGHPRGTTVTIRTLFFNAPARRKFLRAAGTETGHIAEVVSRTALAHFDRGFFLSADGKALLDAAPAADRTERVRQIFGQGLAGRLLPFSRQAGPYRASGFASRPDFSRSSTREQWLFVNGRPVRDRGILHALAEAYRTLLPRGRHAFVLLFLEVPPERVDFNVHPAKSEVRLADPRAAHELTRSAIRGALERERPVVSLAGFEPPAAASEEEHLLRLQEAGEGRAPYRRVEVYREGDSAEGPPGPATLFEPPPDQRLGTLMPLAQYRQSYILASGEAGLVIVDQHVAHERILYEELLKEAEGASVKRQALLFPVSVELGPGQARRLQEGRDELARLGFQVESFGERTVLVREVPALLGSAEVSLVIRDLADDLETAPGTRGLDRVWDRMAATTACHAAVKVNFPLTREKMAFLLEELAKTATPMTCPHGRPILLRLAHRDLEKGFHRQ